MGADLRQASAGGRGTDEHLALLAARVAQVPTEPGCYLWKDGKGEVVYVGKAKSLRATCGRTARARSSTWARPRACVPACAST